MAAVTCYLIRIVRKIFVTFPFDDDLHDGNKFHSLIPSSKCIPQTYIFRHMLPIDENVGKTIKHNLEDTTRWQRWTSIFISRDIFHFDVQWRTSVCVYVCVCVYFIIHPELISTNIDATYDATLVPSSYVPVNVRGPSRTKVARRTFETWILQALVTKVSG